MWLEPRKLLESTGHVWIYLIQDSDGKYLVGCDSRNEGSPSLFDQAPESSRPWGKRNGGALSPFLHGKEGLSIQINKCHVSKTLCVKNHTCDLEGDKLEKVGRREEPKSASTEELGRSLQSHPFSFQAAFKTHLPSKS